MTTHKDDSLPLTGFTPNDRAKVAEKLRLFKDAGAHRLHYLFDFDRTLTSSADFGKDVTIWDLMDDLLPDEIRPAYDRLSKEYQRMESAGRLSEQDAQSWWALSFEFYIQHGMNLNEMRHAIGKLKIREGAIDLFNLCEANDIPTIILSAGVGNVIEMITEEHGIHPTTIMSTKLELAADGRITGWDPDSVVHVLNKHERGHAKLSRLAKERPYTILLGDSLEDAKMIKGEDHIVRIRVVDPHKIQITGEKRYLEESFDAGFDLVVKESLLPVIDLTKWLIAGSNRQSK